MTEEAGRRQHRTFQEHMAACSTWRQDYKVGVYTREGMVLGRAFLPSEEVQAVPVTGPYLTRKGQALEGLDMLPPRQQRQWQRIGNKIHPSPACTFRALLPSQK